MWRELVADKPLTDADRRSLIELKLILYPNALEPGKDATDAIRQAAVDLDLTGRFGARVRITGPVAMADDEYSTVKDGAFVNAAATILVVLLMLWLALRSGRTSFLRCSSILVVGLALTAALGLMMVGSLNLISIAFAVLFVGLGVDFAIQFAVRYRAERYT